MYSDKNKIKRMNIEEQKNLVKYLKGHLNPTTLGILLSLYMGLRIGELCGLTWADIDLNAKILSIRRTVQRVKSYNNGIQKTKIIVSTPKSDTSFREIPIPNFLVRYLQMFQKDNHCYFLSGKEKLIEPRTYQYRYKKILSQVGIKSHNYHQLRHTFATNCIQNGFDIKTLSVILGHKTVNMTLNRYIHPDHVHEQKLMNQLSLLFLNVLFLSCFCVFSCQIGNLKIKYMRKKGFFSHFSKESILRNLLLFKGVKT